MPWTVTDSTFSGIPGGGSTITITEVDENGATRVRIRTKDAGGNTTYAKTTKTDAQGNETMEETNWDPVTGTVTHREKMTKRGRRRVVVTEDEWVNGIKRRRTTSTTFPDSGKFFSDEETWDENGKPIDRNYHHSAEGSDKGYDYHHHVSGMERPGAFRDLPGFVALPAIAGVGAMIGGSVSSRAAKPAQRVRLINEGGGCIAMPVGEDGRFLIPAGFATPGKARVELIDGDDEIAFTGSVKISGAQAAEARLKTITRHKASPALLVAGGSGFADPALAPEDAWDGAGPLVVIRTGRGTGIRRPLAFSDREILFCAPCEASSVRVHAGHARLTDAVKTDLTAPPDC